MKIVNWYQLCFLFKIHLCPLRRIVYTLRVKKIGRSIRFYYQLGGIDYYEAPTDTGIDANIKNEHITLWLDEGNNPEDSQWAYRVDVITFKRLQEFVPGWVELTFPLPPRIIRNKKNAYSMEHAFEGGNRPLLIYKNVDFDTFYNTDPKYKLEPIPELLKG